jgi:hypothetical protein
VCFYYVRNGNVLHIRWNADIPKHVKSEEWGPFGFFACLRLRPSFAFAALQWASVALPGSLPAMLPIIASGYTTMAQLNNSIMFLTCLQVEPAGQAPLGADLREHRRWPRKAPGITAPVTHHWATMTPMILPSRGRPHKMSSLLKQRLVMSGTAGHATRMREAKDSPTWDMRQSRLYAAKQAQ